MARKQDHEGRSRHSPSPSATPPPAPPDTSSTPRDPRCLLAAPHDWSVGCGRHASGTPLQDGRRSLRSTDECCASWRRECQVGEDSVRQVPIWSSVIVSRRSNGSRQPPRYATLVHHHTPNHSAHLVCRPSPQVDCPLSLSSPPPSRSSLSAFVPPRSRTQPLPMPSPHTHTPSARLDLCGRHHHPHIHVRVLHVMPV